MNKVTGPSVASTDDTNEEVVTLALLIGRKTKLI